MQGPTGVTLACGCAASFRTGVLGSPVSVVIEVKAASCVVDMHVPGMPVHDHREALRPSTRYPPIAHSDYEEG